MRPCPRSLDKPLLILGLEGEDIALLLMVFGIPMILISPVVPILALLAAWPGFVFLKRGRPEGYVVHLLYKYGMGFYGLLPLSKTGRYTCTVWEVNDEK